MKELRVTATEPAPLDASELLRQCARDLQNSKLWGEFYSRFRRKILLFLLRAFRMQGGNSGDFARYADDWVQEVFTKLVQNEGRVISSFRGTTEVSVYAFLASIAVSVATDQLRAQRAVRRTAKVVPIDDEQNSISHPSYEERGLTALLELIDVERMLNTNEDSKNPGRDLLIFKLHFIEGLSVREIASMPELKLTVSGLEKVLARMRNRLMQKQEA